MRPTAPRAIVLTGGMGAGKSTAGGRLAALSGRVFIDTDTRVEQATGVSIPALFAERDEVGFRTLEADVVVTALREAPDGAVVALGGGSVESPAVRGALAGHDIVWLDVTPEVARGRVGGDANRPLAGDLDALLARRAPLYDALATHRIDATAPVAEVVAGTARALGIPLPTRVVDAGGYDVLVGSGTLPGVAGALPPAARRAVVVTGDTDILRGHATTVANATRARGLAVTSVVVPDGEPAKTPAEAARLWQEFADAGLTRSDVVIAVGGGSVTDLAGFAAATWLRGVAVVHVPTTLLAMVDAAVGGKTAVNLAAKNCVGAFHDPSAVYCDLATLRTLPADDLRAGFGEVVKCGFVADPSILDAITAEPAAAQDPSSTLCITLVEKTITVKASVVRADPRESSLREILNYGHTVGHAIEARSGYRIRHGEAVSLGMIFAAELAEVAGLLPRAVVDQHREVLAAVGLPTRYHPDAPPLPADPRIPPSGPSGEPSAGAPAAPSTPASFAATLLPLLAADKKTRGRSVRFVVLTGVAAPTRLADPRPEHLEAAYQRLVGPPGPAEPPEAPSPSRQP